MKTRLLFLILILQNCLPTMSQSTKMDTLALEKLSSNIPITTNSTYLKLAFGNDDFICFFNRRISTIDMGNNPPSYTRLTYTKINYIVAKKANVAYYEADGKIRLREANFKKNPKLWIRNDNLCLSRQLTMDKFMEITGSDSTDFVLYPGNMLSPTIPKRKLGYATCLFSGEPHGTRFTLYFDRHKKLYLIQLDIYDIGECEITLFE